ncbi:MAG: GNAT family N-acetyltransferase [Tannerella sp.]|jgi:GNAT superfamily N-acetyltransferase|nr:GNAT family N-acetyltransferase [Tannerella sp.]
MQRCVADNITHPSSRGDKKALALLWKEIFGDADAFVNLFFSSMYKPANALIIRDRDTIVSALYILPYRVKIGVRTFPSAYICGVCTRPSERGKGYMKALMQAAMDEIRSKGYVLATLIPANERVRDFYRRISFTLPLNYSVEVCKKHKVLPSNFNFSPSNFYLSPSNFYILHSTFNSSTFNSSMAFAYFDRKQRQRYCTILHKASDFENIIRDLANDGGGVWTVQNDEDCIQAIAFAKPVSKTQCEIAELFSDDCHYEEILVQHIIKELKVKTAIVRHPSKSAENKENNYGLACILNDNLPPVIDLHISLMLD